MLQHAEGFPPVYDKNSVVLVLGSFPSVKSRQTQFYYGNKQNRFWRTVCGFFGEEAPAENEGKRNFLLRRRIALWDVIIECDIEGSSDSSIQNEVVADIPSVLNGSAITAVLCNGNKAYSLFAERFPQYLYLTKKLSSTSPANPRFSAEEWNRALSEIFTYTQEDNMTYEELLQTLFSQADDTYREFHKKLLKSDAVNVIGVKMPILRKLAKQFKGETDILLAFPDEYYEVTFLKCAAVGLLPFGEFCKKVDRVIPLLDNWATCDCFRAPCIQKNREAFLPYLKRYLSDDREFVKRYGLVTLLSSYMTEAYLPLIFESVKSCKDEPYYVMMAAAWLIAEVLVKFYDSGLLFVKEGKMPVKMHNRAIQKACESYRISPEQKEELKKLKR